MLSWIASIFKHRLFGIIWWSHLLALHLTMALWYTATQHYLRATGWYVAIVVSSVAIFLHSRDLWRKAQVQVQTGQKNEQSSDGEVVTYIKPIIGYRQWGINNNGILISNFDNSEWPVGEPKEARCPRADHHGDDRKSPNRDCVCGIYALKSPLTENHTIAYGKVALWGKVIEHENGYRAQYAYPVEFYVSESVRTMVDKAGEKYNIPVIVLKEEA